MIGSRQTAPARISDNSPTLAKIRPAVPSCTLALIRIAPDHSRRRVLGGAVPPDRARAVTSTVILKGQWNIILLQPRKLSFDNNFLVGLPHIHPGHEHCSGDRRLGELDFSTGPGSTWRNTGFHLAQLNRINSKFQLPKEPNQQRLSKPSQIAVRLIVYEECSSQLSLGL
jgi:hypothetical protein